MAIRFACDVCRELLEVDDDMAGAQATCPFCRSVLRVPAESTPESDSPTPQKTDAGVERPPARRVTGAEVLLGPLSPADLKTNGWGNLALLAAIVAWALFGVVLVYILFQVADVLTERGVMEPTERDVLDAFEEVARDPGKLRMLARLQLAGAGSAVVGIVLSVVALCRRNRRKGTAIAALVLAGTIALCTIVGAVKGASTFGAAANNGAPAGSVGPISATVAPKVTPRTGSHGSDALSRSHNRVEPHDGKSVGIQRLTRTSPKGYAGR